MRWTPKELRERLGLRQAHVAQRIGISRSYYNEIEKGERVPSLRMAQRIADFFGVPLDTIAFPGLESANREHVSTGSA